MAVLRKIFGALRFLPGVLFLIAPGLGSRLFLIPFTPEASLPGRLFGVREVILGSLLWRAQDSEEGWRLYVQAVAVDFIDLIATAICYIEGQLALMPVFTTVGGGILVFLALGLAGLRQEGGYGLVNSHDEQR